MVREVKIHAFKDNSLLRFANTLLAGIQNIPMDIASIDDYLQAGFYEDDVAEHSGGSRPFESEPEPSDFPDS